MPKLVKATISMGDHHLGEGRAMPHLEDFPPENEAAYIAMIEAHLAIIGPDVSCDHIFLGDWFDLLAVRFQGRYGVVPTEAAALEKTAAVLRGHETHFTALRTLLERHPHLRYRIVIGNHDFEFTWPSVQALILKTLAPVGEEARVSFHPDWTVGETVRYVHGAEFDRLNANPAPEEAFKEDVMISRSVVALVVACSLVFSGAAATAVFAWVPSTFGGILLGMFTSFVILLALLQGIVGWFAARFGRKIKILNVRLGSYMHAGFGMWLKRHFFPDIGRRSDPGMTYLLGIARKPYTSLVIAPMLIVEALGYMCVHAFRHAGDRFTWRELWDLIASTTQKDQFEKELLRFLEQHPHIRHLRVGHTHDRLVRTYQVGLRAVEYCNSGMAGREVQTSKPSVACRTRWTVPETFLRRIAYYWVHAPFRALGSVAAYGLLPAALFLAPLSAPVSLLRWPAALAAAFLLLWRQAAAEYKDTMFFRFLPSETLEYDDGSIRARALHYDHETGRFHLLTGEPATWDAR